MSVTWGYIASYNGETLTGRWVSSMDTYVAGTTPTTGAEVAYELATPTEITGLTPHEIDTLYGDNNIYADTGTTTVEYRSTGTVTPVPVVPTLITKNITDNGTYYAEDDDADGYSSVTVNVPTGSAWDVNMDFTGITTSYIVNGVTFNSNGAVFDSTSDYIAMPFVHGNGVEIEIDVASMTLTADQHRRLLCSDDNKGLYYSRSSGKWCFYNGTDYASNISDGSYFANSTVKIVIDSNNYWHIYKDGVLVFEPQGALALKNVMVGSTNASINNVTITGIRIRKTT